MTVAKQAVKAARRTGPGQAPRWARVWPRSLRWRLQLWLALLLVAMLAAMIATAYELLRVNLLQQIDAELETRLTTLTLNVRELSRGGPQRGRGELGLRDGRLPQEATPGRGERPSLPGRGDRRPSPDARAGRGGRDGRDGQPPLPLSPQTTALFGAGTGYYFTIWPRDGLAVAQSVNAPVDVPPPKAVERDSLPHHRIRAPWREVVQCASPAECILVGVSVAEEPPALRTLRWRLAAAGGLVLTLGLAMAWAIGAHAIRPFEAISAAAVRISGGDLSERVKIVDPDTEFGRLASVLNTTFGQLEAAFARQLQFTADATHELRTPLSALISATQTALSCKRTAVEYRETVVGCLETAQQMRRLTETLLALARIDAFEESLARGPVDLSTVAVVVAERLRREAEAREITMHFHLAPVNAFTVRERVDQVMTNLLANAIYYNHQGGEVHLSTRSEKGSAAFTVSNTGSGIAAAHLPHIFDRFYRADTVRSRADGHAGLGLAICKSIVDAERGTITVASVEREGASFTVKLPTRPVPAAT